MPVYKMVNKDFFKKWSPEMAYVTGFFAADGYITVNKRGGQFWCIQITDKKLLEQIRKVVGSEHKISKRTGTGNEKNLYRLQIGSIEMCNDLRELGFSERKTKNLVVPNISQTYLNHFIRGYFDGDGNVWSGVASIKRKIHTKVLQVAFTSGSVEFLRELLLLLRGRGVRGGSIYCSKNKDFGRLSFGTSDALKLYEIMYNMPHNLYLNRKKVVFERFIKMRP